MKCQTNNMEEIWKDIKNYEGLYQVSNFGRIKSLQREFYNKNQYGINSKRKTREIIKKTTFDTIWI